MSKKPLFNVGEVVRCKVSFLNEPPGFLALVYENYNIAQADGGVSIISETGKDIGGFSYEEQKEFLEIVSETGFEYDFKNVTQLYTDWRNGVFDDVFKRAKSK